MTDDTMTKLVGKSEFLYVESVASYLDGRTFLHMLCGFGQIWGCVTKSDPCSMREIDRIPIPGTTLTSLRPLTQGMNGVVVASHPAAAMAGYEVLRRGGNAVDAGVATGLRLNVVHSHECSFLGVGPMLMYLADRNAIVEIDDLGWWPKAATLDYFQQHHGGKLPPGTYRTLTPGAADAWFTALAQTGSSLGSSTSSSAASEAHSDMRN